MINTFKVDKNTGLLLNATYIPSSNADERTDTAQINLLVIHNISLPPGDFSTNSIQDFFLGKLNPAAHPYFQEIAHLKVSSHLLIRRDGELLQFVPFHKRAWHAGESQYLGKNNCNDFSIGIELEGTDILPFEKVQYAALANIIDALLATYPKLSLDRIVGHQDIAPGRKTDPGQAFDWGYLKGLLA